VDAGIGRGIESCGEPLVERDLHPKVERRVGSVIIRILIIDDHKVVRRKIGVAVAGRPYRWDLLLKESG
jgi:hypothetical protein